jgi:hypothetical protein
MSLRINVSIDSDSIARAAWTRAVANRERLKRRLDVQAGREEASQENRRAGPWEQLYTTPTPLRYRPDEPVAYPARRVTEPPVDPEDYVFPLPPVGEGATDIISVPAGYYLVSHWVYSFSEETTPPTSPYSSIGYVDSTGFIDALQWGAATTVGIQTGRPLREYQSGEFQRSNFGTVRITNPPPSRSFQVRGVGGVSGPYTFEEVLGLTVSPPAIFPPSIDSPIIRAGFADIPPTGWEGE